MHLDLEGDGPEVPHVYPLDVAGGKTQLDFYRLLGKAGRARPFPRMAWQQISDSIYWMFCRKTDDFCEGNDRHFFLFEKVLSSVSNDFLKLLFCERNDKHYCCTFFLVRTVQLKERFFLLLISFRETTLEKVSSEHLTRLLS